MFSGARLIVVVVLLYYFTTTEGKSIKKSKDESAILNKKLIGKPKPPPAIIAIEIVDPNENKTSKNSKRTVDSSLGYGYQRTPPPRYEVYKYSQHDIPPYRGPHNIFNGGIKTHQYDVQKSVSYKAPGGGLTQYYQPGTTLYSTVNHQGQVGSLSSHLPQQQYEQEPQVPVIILRVYPSQLGDPSAVLHPNLPQNHPLASTVNSIDIQSLLAKYVQNLLLEQQHYQPQDYQYQQEYQYVQQPQYQDYSDDGGDELLTHENYPKDTHTRVIFHTNRNHHKDSHKHKQTKTIQVALPSQSYSSVEVQTPNMQYSYATQPGSDNQNYYYPQQNDNIAQNYYYQPEPKQIIQKETPQQNVNVAQNYYYQPEPKQTIQKETPQQTVQNYYYQHEPKQTTQKEIPQNSYQSQHKRSKKNRYSSRARRPGDEIIKLDPIKA